jgi:hypothetical protein
LGAALADADALGVVVPPPDDALDDPLPELAVVEPLELDADVEAGFDVPVDDPEAVPVPEVPFESGHPARKVVPRTVKATAAMVR